MVRRAPSFRQVPGADVAERPPNTVEEELCGGNAIKGVNRLRGPTPLPPRPRLHQQMVPLPPPLKWKTAGVLPVKVLRHTPSISRKWGLGSQLGTNVSSLMECIA